MQNIAKQNYPGWIGLD